MQYNYALTAALLPIVICGEALSDDEISEITVKAARVANDSPASSYATAATMLRFDPLTELQSRGIAEGQSAVATVSYGINRVKSGGYVALGSGSDSLNFQSLRIGHSTTNSLGNDVGMALSLSRSEGDGSLAFGDHEFARANMQFQHATSDTQTDLIVSYQDKFFGWPGEWALRLTTVIATVTRHRHYWV